MWERFPPRMRRAVAGALAEAGTRGCEAVTPAHLLLAIASDPQSAGVFVMERCGVAPRGVVEALREAASGNGSGPVRPRASRLSDETVELLRAACAEAARLKHEHVGTEHVVLAIARFDASAVRDALSGVTHDAAEAALREWFARDMPRRRAGLDRVVVRSPVLRKVLAPLQKAARLPVQAWSVYVGRSLAHPRFVSDPYAMYRWLREREPVRKDPLAPVWIVTRYDDVVTTLRDPRFRKDPFAAERLPRAVREQLAAPPDARSDIEAVSMLFLDPPAHTRVRSIFTRAFGPKVVEALRPRIEAITQQRLDEVQPRGEADLVAQLAYPLPVIVIAELLGFPGEDYERIKRWSDEMTHALSLRATTADHVRAGLARQELRAYFDELAPKVKANPGRDVLSALLTREDDPAGEALNREEIFSNCMLLLAAGHETTTNLIGNAIVALLRHPEQLAALRVDPAAMETAIEEFLRYDNPVQWTSRVAGEDLELGGQRIAKGELVLGSLGSANRDPAVFDHPETLDLRRSPNRHIAFGQGPHFCLGAMLAKMEASIAIGEVVRRFPKLRLAASPRRLRWHQGLTFRGVRALPVRWD